MKKRGIWIVVGLLVLLTAGFFGYRAYASGQASAEAEIQTATVQRGNLESSLSSSGNTRTGQSATITWQTSGKVSEIKLKPGDVVTEDQVLAELDGDTLSAEMIKARQDLADAQQSLDDLLNSKVAQAQALQAVLDAQSSLDNLNLNAAEALSAAQLEVANAQDTYDKAVRTRTKMNYPHSTDKLVIEKAETDYLLAKQAYKEALQEYNKYVKRNLTNPERVRALNNLIAAKQKMDKALTLYNWYLLGYTDNEIAQADGEVAVAKANLESAQAKLASLQSDDQSAAIALAEAILADAQRAYERVKDGASDVEIAAATAAVEAAQATIDNTRLLAPFTGTITEVDVKTGDLVKSGDVAFRIDDMESLYVDLQISEVDLENLKLGQSATLEFDAIANKEYNGEVTEIGMIGTVSQGVVNFPVTVRITNADENLRPGMTASVSIITNQTEDALLVPNKAVRTVNGERVVLVLFEGQQITVPVTVGLVNGTMSEVTSSQLREGDTVVLSGSSSSSASQSSGNQGRRENFFIEGGGGPPIIAP